MTRVKYEVDPHNRLIIKKTGKRTRVERFRQVLDGKFRVSADNSLTYHIKAPTREGVGAPHQVKLKGKWLLDKNHNLEFTLDKVRSQVSGDKLTLQGEILGVDKNSLLFSVTTRTEKSSQSIYALKLEGSWQADKNNRLCFRVKKEQGRDDILTFDGIWQIGKNYQLIYQYTKAKLSRSQREIHTLIFKGYWDIRDKTRLSYVLERGSGQSCSFNFRTSVGVFKDRYIKYRLGIGLTHRQEPVEKTITFFGSWKVNKATGLTFEVEYEKRRVQSIVFGAEVELTDKDTLLFNLRNDVNKGLGVELKLSHKFLKGSGEAFLRAIKTRGETAILVGAGGRW